MGLESMQTHNPSGQRIPQVSAKFLLRECSKGEGRHALRVSSPATGLKVGGSSDKVTLSQPRDETGVQVSCSPRGTPAGTRGLPGPRGVSCGGRGQFCKSRWEQGHHGLPQRTVWGFCKGWCSWRLGPRGFYRPTAGSCLSGRAWPLTAPSGEPSQPPQQRARRC